MSFALLLYKFLCRQYFKLFKAYNFCSILFLVRSFKHMHVFKFYLKTRATAFVTTYARFELFTLEGESSVHLKSCGQRESLFLESCLFFKF